ncbi:biotinidase [Salpingoeca rosetta]|uniref:Biotinidase n=1 Tax=Salpingoeca rosetta (strain ATCC 50818 / BSB-021) TaxID=946362 RepID=F2UEU9_SALR5|nr:biotinidase [Salpingoeca rosetta]EGD75149.1 biotinidase [Salpingoeca rosetta]|eukprot:XP_004992202.1 biotinidase [Salpingoeca rosetta]
MAPSNKMVVAAAVVALLLVVMAVVHVPQGVMVAAAAAAPPHYRAAVFQHYRTKEAKRPQWSKMQNVASYKNATARAAAQGARIIVFPEVGLGGNAISRALNMEFAEDVPDGRDSINPCWDNDPNYCTARPALCALSCMAAEHGMYVVVGMNDRKACNATSDPHCPKDGAYLFNTGVVFDSYGTVIARYHKKHIFTPFPVFDTPNVAEVRYFDTDFGVRFGIFICFDSLFPDPPLELVKQGIKHFVFPTSWTNVPPILTATQYQQAWSRAFNTTFLAANTAEHGTSGSGIYACGHPIATYFNYTADGLQDEQLLVADVPTDPCAPVSSSLAARSVTTARLHKNSKQSSSSNNNNNNNNDSDNNDGDNSGSASDSKHCGTIGVDPCACDIVDAVPGKSGTLTAEFNGLKCTAQYSFAANQTATNERYGLVVYSGTAWFLEPLPAQICTLVRCATPQACITPDVSGDFLFPAHTLVNSFSIQGNFTYAREQQFPLLVEDGGQLLPKTALHAVVNGIASSGSVWPRKLLAASIIGRPWNSTTTTTAAATGGGKRRIQGG